MTKLDINLELRGDVIRGERKSKYLMVNSEEITHLYNALVNDDINHTFSLYIGDPIDLLDTNDKYTIVDFVIEAPSRHGENNRNKMFLPFLDVDFTSFLTEELGMTSNEGFFVVSVHMVRAFLEKEGGQVITEYTEETTKFDISNADEKEAFDMITITAHLSEPRKPLPLTEEVEEETSEDEEAEVED